MSDASTLDRQLIDPDRQQPLPFAAAEDYARAVMTWARTLSTDGMAVRRDIAYGPHALHRLDVFSPPDAHGAPVVVFWHGGGWTNGYRDYVSFMAPHLVAMGCVLVAPSYRLAPQCPLPAAFDDALAATRHAVGHARQWGGAPDRIYLAGHSAGAHLATLVALREAARRDAGIPASHIRGCLPISGIMDLHHADPAPGSLDERVYTMVLSTPEQDAPMSPLCWAAGNRLPLLLSCGADDSERVLRSNRRLAALLALQPGPSRLHVEPGLDHFGTHTDLRRAEAPWYRRLAGLIEAHDA